VTLLEVENLTKSFPEGDSRKTVLRDISFQLGPRDSLSIAGPSGCGKSTLLLILAGLLDPSGGGVTLGGRPVCGPTREMALVFQEYGLFPWKRVADNITLGARLQGLSYGDEDLSDLKEELGIQRLDHLYPGQLSGGQRQRVALARALLLRPKLLLLDEPFAALDAITRERLQNHLLRIFQQREFSFIIVTHNIEEAAFLGRRVMVIDPATQGIGDMVDNDDMGNPEYRDHPNFFQRGLTIRRLLEGAT
jgi:NitT/TauT family transport system ATP-binding protein